MVKIYNQENDMKTYVIFIQGGGEGAHAEDSVLADSLGRALGANYVVRFPRMPGESDPKFTPWKHKIIAELSRASGRVVMVAHSVGGSMLLRCLSEEKIEQAIAGLFVLAAPSWDEDHWNFEDLKLAPDIADRLAAIPRIFFYHCRDDDIVPFAHLALYGAKIPQATICAIDNGGHQFGNGLASIAADIRGEESH